ncbi:hypothetical protein F4777DRAFT_126099 [Nemania sp. FL0916]|nr:hypothetical protein F4777DRAFT_126099 [Nemania sp. FL0916]
MLSSRLVFGAGATTALTGFCFAGLGHAAAAAACTREGLLAAANSYLAAQASGNTADLPLSATNFTYRQNNRAAAISTGILSQPLAIDLNRTTADTEACASYAMLISAATGSTPYVISTQIHVVETPTNSSNGGISISMIDSVVATTGSLFFDAAKTLSYIQEENWGPLDETQRATRAELKRVGDAYLDMWTDANAADSIPWGTDCERVEGSMYTAPCGATLPRGGSARPNGDRRYVIDETVGSVDVLCSFDSLGPWPDSHEIRLEGGLVKYVHTVTVLG